MININTLTQGDIGRSVVYKQTNRSDEFEVEQGIITSFNDTYVFVRYSVCGGGQATNPNDLSFI